MSKAIYVYVCTTRDGTKIGATRNVENRMKSLSRGRLVKSWHRPADARTVENTALKLIEASPVYGNECFDVTAEHAVSVVERAIVMADNGTAWPTKNSQRIERKERELRDFADMLNEIGKRYIVQRRSPENLA